MKDEMMQYYKNSLLDGLCAEYKGRWQGAHGDKEKLVRLVLNQQALPHFLTYCHNGKGLSMDFLMDAYADYINGQYTAIDADGVEGGGYKSQLYIGHNDNIHVESTDVLALGWCNVPSLEIKPTKSVKVYVGCSSNVYIDCGGYNNVIVMLFDDSVVHLEDIDEDSHVMIYRYSDDAVVERGKYCISRNVKVFDKELKL